MPFTLYLLLCSDKTYFTGLTTNLDKRLLEHNLGQFRKCYTYKRRPLSLSYFHEFDNQRTAEKRYLQIKNWSQAKKEALIHGNYAALPNLAKKKF